MTIKRCVITVGVFLLGGLLAFLFITLRIGYFLDATQPPAQVDAIIVLGGEGSSFPRTQHALVLHGAGRAPLVVFSGGTLRDAGLACSSAQLSQEAALHLGLPASAIVLAPEAQSTYDEAVNLGALAQEKGWQSLLLVTDRFHIRRALRTFQALAPDVVITVSAPHDPRYDPSHWWTTEAGLVSVVTEVLKLGFYWTNYGIPPWRWAA